jgi:thymidylate synthase (FAD)
MAHATNAQADALLDKEFRVLDRGFVRLIDYMGGDDAIVQAARVSYGEGTKKVHEDRGLIRYLMRHQHTTPFEMVEFKFHVKLPIFVARQWIRHRSANVNEYSGRYSVMKEEFFVPKPEDIRPQSTSNRQGRSDAMAPPEVQRKFIEYINRAQHEAYAAYNEFLEADIARELARINLPLSMYTEWYWKIDLHNLFHFLHLRLDRHAQEEIRVYAEVMAGMVKTVCPMAYEAFEDYRLNSVSLSQPELNALQEHLRGFAPALEQLTATGLSKREATEFLDKLNRLRSK